ncbi:hypothetical protein CM49_04854 [Paenibacillus sp. P1XP2]|nr:hypothetical protein CM49_04854 [Paenibacillus sp. P1XP2]
MSMDENEEFGVIPITRQQTEKLIGLLLRLLQTVPPALLRQNPVSVAALKDVLKLLKSLLRIPIFPSETKPACNRRLNWRLRCVRRCRSQEQGF